MRCRDIYEEMIRSGHYSDASDYRDSCERHGHSMSEFVKSYDREDVQDGCAYTSVGDRAMDAAREIEYEQRRAYERRQEEEEREREEQRYRREQSDRQRYEDEMYNQQQEPEPPQEEEQQDV